MSSRNLPSDDRKKRLFFNSVVEERPKRNAVRREEYEDSNDGQLLHIEYDERIKEKALGRTTVEPEQIFQHFQRQNNASKTSHKRSLSYNLQNMELASTGQNTNFKHLQ